MIKNSITLASLLLVGCAVAQPNSGYTSSNVSQFYDAPVVSNTPIIQQFTIQQEECRTEIVQPAEPGVGGAIVGGIIGAALGNRVGGGSGRDIATAAGAVAGASIGSQAQNSPRQVQVCQPYYETVERIVGHRVTYQIGDRQYTQTLSYSPGNTIRVRLIVQ